MDANKAIELGFADDIFTRSSLKEDDEEKDAPEEKPEENETESDEDKDTESEDKPEEDEEKDENKGKEKNKTSSMLFTRKTNGQDGYAGYPGKAIDQFQLTLAK